jgi:hypothetical protein
MLHLPLPANYENEREFNLDLTNFFHKNYNMGISYEHNDSSKANVSVSAISKYVITYKDAPIEIILTGEGFNPTDSSCLFVVDFPSHGALTVGSRPNSVKYIPNNGYTGYDIFTYVATDNHGATSGKATVNILINIPPQPPSLTNKSPTADLCNFWKYKKV